MSFVHSRGRLTASPRLCVNLFSGTLDTIFFLFVRKKEQTATECLGNLSYLAPQLASPLSKR